MPYLVYDHFGDSRKFSMSGETTTLGRMEGNDLVLRDHTVSRRHAKLEKSGDGWVVVDLGSRNGVKVNGVQTERAPVKPGDVLTLGMVELRLEVEHEGEDRVELKGGQDEDLFEGTIVRSVEEVQAMLAMESGKARDQLREEDVDHLSKVTRILSVLSDMAKLLITAVSMEEVLQKVMEVIFQNLQARRGVILLADPETEELRPSVIRQEVEDADTIQISQTIARKVYDDGVAILTSDAQADPRFQAGESIRFLGIRSAICVPLSLGERVLGLIYVDTPLRVKAFDEFDLELLSALAGYGAMAIHQARLRSRIEEERQARNRLERYHSPAVADRILQSKGDVDDSVLDVREQEVTILFSDLVGFTSMTENMAPRDVAHMLNDYFSKMTEVIFRHEGTLDKFIGDAIMAIFGAPLPTENHALQAVQCASEMRKALAEFNENRTEGAPPLQFRVGINTGRVVAGDIGSLRRMDYTVLGNTVNLASRLESEVARPGHIVLGETTHSRVGQSIPCRRLEDVHVKGISKPVTVYEVNP